MLLYELPSTAAERRAWAEWDRNLPVMKAKYKEFQEANMVRIPLSDDDNDSEMDSNVAREGEREEERMSEDEQQEA